MKTLPKADQFKKGAKIVYNDGRVGHSGVYANVLEVNSRGMWVQFMDRADSTYISFGEPQWMNFIELAG